MVARGLALCLSINAAVVAQMAAQGGQMLPALVLALVAGGATAWFVILLESER